MAINQLFMPTRLPTNSGGVEVFAADKYLVSIVGKNKLNCTCEDIWLQLTDSITSNTFILGIVYCHPKGNVNNFITSLNEKLQQLKRGSTSKYYVVGDFNINVNPPNSNESSSNFLYMLASSGAFLLIDKPTRVFSETRTLNHHIITNDTCNIIYPCVFLCGISDHFSVACLVAINSSSKKGRSHLNKVSYSYRDMSRFDIEQLRLEFINL